MKKWLIIIGIIVILAVVAFIFYNYKYKLNVLLEKDKQVEVNTVLKVKELVKKVTNGKIKNKNESIDFTKLGKQKVKVIIVDNLKKEKNYYVYVNVVDTIEPEIEAKDKLTTTEGQKIDLLKDVKVTDNSGEEIEPSVEGKYDFNKAGSYDLKYVAEDSSGNKKEVDFTLVVKEKTVVKATTSSNSGKFFIRVNKTQNVVMVYSKDDNEEYTNLVKTFVASAGNNTPVGTFTTSDKVETLSLVGNVWGHYTMRIVKAIWFHSVPYYSKPVKGEDGKLHWNDLEYEEYNKLGSLASAGCIRLAVIDAKWIYDNIPSGTKVEIYESDTLPDGVVKPSAKKIDVNSEYRGWDPTDPDPENPWHNQ